MITDDDLAIDIGCGTGQSTVLLVPYFRRIMSISDDEYELKLSFDIFILINRKI
jgi:precorrin-6B methylase 2